MILFYPSGITSKKFWAKVAADKFIDQGLGCGLVKRTHPLDLFDNGLYVTYLLILDCLVPFRTGVAQWRFH